MQTNNNLLTQIFTFVLALVLIVLGGLLFFFGKIDQNVAGYFFGAALTLFGVHMAWQAPSPAQQAALQQLVAQALQAQAQPVPTPVVAPQIVPTMPQNMTAAAQPIDATWPSSSTMPSAMLTTGMMPSVKPPQ